MLLASKLIHPNPYQNVASTFTEVKLSAGKNRVIMSRANRGCPILFHILFAAALKVATKTVKDK